MLGLCGFSACEALAFLNVKAIRDKAGLWAATEEVGVLPPPDVTAEEDFHKFLDGLRAHQIQKDEGRIQLFTMDRGVDYSAFSKVREKAADSALLGSSPISRSQLCDFD